MKLISMGKPHNVTMLESIARRVIKGFDPSLLMGTPEAIPIEKIAGHLGLAIEYQCLRKNGVVLGEMVYNDSLVPVYLDNGIKKGYTLIKVKGGTIMLDESLLLRGKEGRLRFTCAHEIAHYLLHKSLYAVTGRAAALGNPKKSSEENPYVERQADILGTALLMPKGQVKKAFYEHRNASDPVKTLAGVFQVSKQAMGIFLKDSKLI